MRIRNIIIVRSSATSLTGTLFLIKAMQIKQSLFHFFSWEVGYADLNNLIDGKMTKRDFTGNVGLG